MDFRTAPDKFNIEFSLLDVVFMMLALSETVFKNATNVHVYYILVPKPTCTYFPGV